MSFLFGKKKTPQEAVKSLHKYIAMIGDNKGTADADLKKKIDAKLVENIDAIKLYAVTPDNEPEDAKKDDAKRESQDKIADLLLQDNSLVIILYYLSSFTFESRKDIASIFTALWKNYTDRMTTYVTQHQNIISIMIEAYHESECALTCGALLRDLITRSEEITLLLLQPTYETERNLLQPPTRQSQPINNQLPSPHLDRLFGFIQSPTFDTAQDAFSTLKWLLTRHKKLIAKFLEANFHDFFTKYSQLLLLSDNYVTKRLGLKLLAELLLTRENFNVMIKFINIPEYLKIIMSMLRGTTKSIQLEAFHVFKVFVANPRKSIEIQNILYRNKDKLIEFLTNFHRDKADDQFNEEKTILLSTLIQLEPPH